MSIDANELVPQVIRTLGPDEVAKRLITAWEGFIDEEFSCPWWAWRRRRRARAYQQAAMNVMDVVCRYVP